MAKRKLEMESIDDQGEAGDATSLSPRKREVARARITLTMKADTIKRLRHASIALGVQPCKFVEDLLDPVVRPYTLSIRNGRVQSESGEAA